MKSLKLIGILSFAIILLSSNTILDSKMGLNDDWKSLSEEKYSIKYPDSWEINMSGQMGTRFIMFSPLSSKEDQFRENVNLIIQDLSQHQIDLDQYVELSETQIRSLIDDSKILESVRLTSNDLSYHKVIYSGKQGILDLKFEQYYWVVNEEAFVLTLTCEESQFDNYQEIGEKILNSFQVK